MSPPSLDHLLVWVTQRAPHQLCRDEHHEEREGVAQNRARDGVRERHARGRPGDGGQTQEQRVAATHVAVAVLLITAHDRHRDDRQERGRLSLVLAEAYQEHQPGHEQDAAADAEHPRDHTRGRADRDRPGGHRRPRLIAGPADRKSTRLNSSHMSISYAVFCLKKKKHFVVYLFPAYIHDTAIG